MVPSKDIPGPRGRRRSREIDKLPIRFPRGIQPRKRYTPKKPPKLGGGLQDDSLPRTIEERRKRQEAEAAAARAAEAPKTDGLVDIKGLWDHFGKEKEKEKAMQILKTPEAAAPEEIEDAEEIEERTSERLSAISAMDIIKLKLKLRKSRVIVMAVVLAIVLTPLFVIQLQEPEGPEWKVSVNGNFKDWNSIDKYSDSLDELSAGDKTNIDITNVALFEERSIFFAYIEVFGDMILAGNVYNLTDLGKNTVGDSILIFIDINPDLSEGYSVFDIKADYMLEVIGFDGLPYSTMVYKFNERYRTYESRTLRDTKDWSAWEFHTWANIGVGESEIEVSFSFDMPEDNKIEDYQFVFQARDHYGNYDFFDRTLTLAQPELLAKRTDNEKEIITNQDLADGNNRIWMFSLELESFNGDSTLNKLLVTKLGNLEESEVFSILVYEDIDSDLSYSRTDKLIVTSIYGFLNGLNELELPNDGIVVPESERKTIHIVVEFKSTASAKIGETFGIEVQKRYLRTDSVLTYQRDPEVNDKLHYIVGTPDEIVIDGLFDDWKLGNYGTVTDDVDLQEVLNSNINLRKYGHSFSEPELAVYMSVEEGMLEGDNVPAYTRYFLRVDPGKQEPIDLDGDGRKDLNGDGEEEGYGSKDNDYNNNGVPDDVDPDIDGDLVPNDDDLEPRNPVVGEFYPDLPERFGLDIIKIYIDLDDNPLSGYQLERAGTKTGAEMLLEFRGRSGIIYTQEIYILSAEGTLSGLPEWQKDIVLESKLQVELDKSNIEAMVDITSVLDMVSQGPGSKLNVFYVMLMWDGSEVDYSNNLLVPGGPTTRAGELIIPISSTSATWYISEAATEESNEALSSIYMMLTSGFVAVFVGFLWKIGFFSVKARDN